MGIEEVLQTLPGLSLFKARKKLDESGFKIGFVKYMETDEDRLVVLAAAKSKADSSGIDLTVSGVNPIRFLPSMYQNNDFLKRFLWIPQHLHYELVSILDNLHFFFTPVESPENFLNWLGSWFGVSDKLELNQQKMRLFLQNAILLYKWRGTIKGMKMMIKIITGIIPEIIENSFPPGEYVIFENSQSDTLITNEFEKDAVFFTVHLPVEMDRVESSERNAVYNLVKQEKPANTRFVVTWKKKEVVRKSGDLISNTTVIYDNGARK